MNVNEKQDEDEIKYEQIDEKSKAYKKQIIELEICAKHLESFCDNEEYMEYVDEINDFHDYFDEVMN